MIYTFHRKDCAFFNGFYPLELESDSEAIANAIRNPGTLRVVNEVTKKEVFKASTQPPDEV
jgi:hypothetical protein